MTAPATHDYLWPILAPLFATKWTEGAVTFEAARELSSQIAGSLSADADTVLDRLTYVPDNMLVLLQSPEGWVALAEYVAADLGLGPVGFAPTIH